MDKQDKELLKEQKNKEKQEATDKQIAEAFEQKKRDAKGSTVDQLKVWLDNTPFKSTNTELKRQTLFAIMSLVANLKSAEIDTLCGAAGQDGLLNTKQAFTLCKYIFQGFTLIQSKDK